MKYVITGGAGYIGSHLVHTLLRNENQVVSIDDQSVGNYIFLEEIYSGNDLQLVRGDIRDQDLLNRVLLGFDGIAHLAAVSGLQRCLENPEGAVSTNIYGTHQVLESARKNDVRRIVFCSTAAVYGSPTKLPVKETDPLKPINLYGVTKLGGEKLMEAYHENYGLESVILRFGNVYGVGFYTRWDTVIPKFVKQALEGSPLTLYGDGKQSRDFVHIKDINQAIILSLMKKGIDYEVFNVGGETLTISQVAAIVEEEVEGITGKEVKTTFVSPRLGESKEFSYNLNKIREKLGFENRGTVRQGIRELIHFRLKQLG